METVLDRRRRWLIFATLFSAHGLIVGSTSYSFGLFIGPLESEFGWQRTAITAALSFLALESLLSPVIGRLIDVYGARPIMTCSLALVGLSFLLRPFMTELSHWYALTLMQFVAMTGATALPSGRLIPIWFQSAQGRVMGFTTMGINIGGITLPLLVIGLLRISSWEIAFMAFGVISLMISASAFLFIRDRKEKEAFREAKNSKTNDLEGFTLSHALRTRSFFAIVAAVMFGSFAHAGVLPQLPNFFMTRGTTDAFAALSVSVMAVSGLISKPAFGYLSERITARLAMMIILAGQAVALTIMVLVPSIVITWVALPFFGIGMGAHSALFPLLVRETFGGREVAGIMGAAAMATVLPFGLGPVLASASVDLTEGYELAFAGFAVLFAVAAVSQTQILPFSRKGEI